MEKKQFIARASQIGKLMTNDRTGKAIGKTAINSLKEMLLFDKYGFEREISSKYLEKGIQNEKTAIKLAVDVLGWFDVDPETPQVRLINEFITGKPDINTKSKGADIKNSWSAFSFPFDDLEIPSSDYFFQAQSYCWLTNKSEWSIVYCLTDASEQLIIDEVNRAVWKNLGNPFFEDKSQSEIEEFLDEKIRHQMTFSHLPKDKRVKEFVIKADEQMIEKMKARVEECRVIYDKMWEII
jgi:hypothetical protein